MAYIKIATKEIITAARIMQENSNVTFPATGWPDELLAPFGYAVLHQPDSHPFPATKYEELYQDKPALIDGKWTVQYAIRSIVPSDPTELELFISQEKLKLKQEVAGRRYQVETSGITLSDGTSIKTDRESQATLTGALSYLTLNPTTTIDWKGNAGWVALGLEQITAISTAVGSHVQQAFTNEKVHAEAIGKLTTVQELLDYNINANWYDNEVS